MMRSKFWTDCFFRRLFKQSSFSALLFFLMGVSLPVEAREPTHEVAGDTVARIVLGDNNAIQLGGEYLTTSVRLVEGLQIGGRVGFENHSALSSFNMMVVGIYNFIDFAPFSDAFFAGGGLGLYNQSSGGSGKTNFAIEAIGGKRFKLFSNVYWKPQARLSFVFDGPTQFILIPVSFSVSFDL